ncbi:MOB kinase activator 1A [Hondaea fermentalgiana]|uniref:MOB kinase activator 1A n=1 Tax=Hondaea fermentalgiana TaxID=2315210 RepID=A0A2R5GQE2_9STRA|nr:MOB kinase activator 1A [Hondaea fermentalgiana]|eukprot:GBG33092.1 MOB kinase activator 1A [Hondaea fermentalgiana]
MAEDDAKNALPRLAVEAEAKDLAATSCVAFEEEKDTSLPVKAIVFAQSRSEQCDADGPAASMKSSAGKQKLNKASAATAKTSMAKARAKPSWAVRRNHILHHNRLQELGLESGDNNEDVGAAVNCVICQAAKEPPYTIKEDADNAMDRVCPTNANKAFASHNHEDSRQEDGDKDREEGEQESRQEAIWTARDGTQQDPNASPASNFRGPETSLRTRLVPSESRDSQSTISTDASSLEPEVVDETAEEEPLLLVGEIGRREETYEWLATNLFQFFKEVCLMYDMCSEELEERFAEIGQGFPPHYEYRWAAPLGAPKRKPVRMSGPEYVQHVLGWVEATMNNRLYFPVDENVLFPDDFLDIVQKVYTRIFRVYAILFHHCLQILHEQDAEDFLHKSFRHFMFLVLEYNLVRDREFKAMRAAVDQVKEAYEASLQRPSAHLVDLGHVITAPIDPQVVAILASLCHRNSSANGPSSAATLGVKGTFSTFGAATCTGT